MRTMALAGILAASVSLGACTTTDRYGYRNDNNRQLERAATGAAIGAAAGAVAGAAIDGITPTQGAIGGAIVGGAVGAATSDSDRWSRDSRGYCYRINNRGDRVYDYDRNC